MFYIFTNDNEWVKKNIKLPDKAICIFRGQDEVLPDYLELQLISACKHFIISNSTFHWWGAWLSNSNNKIVVRPKLWFSDGTKTDIYPPTWVNLGL